MTQAAVAAAKMIRQRLPNFKPKLAIVTGSGLGALATRITAVTVIPYSDLPGFHTPRVEGHGGQLFLGTLSGVPIVCMQGRVHYYEGVANTTLQTMVRVPRLLGCEMWLATNASGSLCPTVGPGSLMVVTDHINFQFNNPLVGPNDDKFGERFVSLENAYDQALREALMQTANQLQIRLTPGVYAAMLGPAFETPAEIKALRLLGADLVGMSTVPEVILARHCGMRVAVIAAITNMAAGMSAQAVTHAQTLRGAELAAENLIKLVMAFVQQLS